jgi:hypothetical protein
MEIRTSMDENKAKYIKLYKSVWNSIGLHEFDNNA